MYTRYGLSLRHLVRESSFFWVLVLLWSLLVIFLHDTLGWLFLAVPDMPIANLGIAVSVYLGFKTTSSYHRWWEARRIWGDIVNASRTWGVQVTRMPGLSANAQLAKTANDLVLIQLAWVNALAAQLRQSSRLKPAKVTRMFDHRRDFDDPEYHQVQPSFERFLSEEEHEDLARSARPSLHLLSLQGRRLRELLEAGALDSIRYAMLMGTQTRFFDAQGACERIKNTPFPRQVTMFGRAFTMFLIFLLPLAFVDEFDNAAVRHGLSSVHSYLYMTVMLPFSVLLSYVFFLMEKVSESMEDPFEGGVFDVPISTITRMIEIDLLNIARLEPLPEPLEPIDGVAY